jgi:phosphoserine phosphatase
VRYVEALVPDARAVCAALHEANVDVRIMSGGLHPAVLAVAAALGIRDQRVAAVDIRFSSDGAYAGYDAASPLSRSGGKRDIMKEWRRAIGGPVMMVGDGVTDAEAAEVADVFVAYAGVVERAAATSLADVIIRSRSLAPVLPLALGSSRPRSPDARKLYDLGLNLLDDEYRSLVAHADE